MVTGMKNIKLCSFLIIMLYIIAFANICTVSASSDVISDAAEASNADELESNVSDEASEFLDEHGINISDPTTITSLSPSEIMDYLVETVKEKAAAPFKLFVSLIGVVLLYSVMGSLGGTAKASAVRIYEIIGVLACAAIISEPVCDCIELTADTLSCGSTFINGFVPVFVGIAAAAGGLTSAASYNVIVLFTAGGAAVVSDKILIPLLGMCMSMSFVDALNPSISLSSLIDGIKKVCTWILSIIMTIFAGLLTIQSIVGASADSLAVRTGKFLASSLIPVVGSAVSDAYVTVRSSMGILRSGVGAFGIIVLLLTVLPAVLTILLYRVAFSTAAVTAEMFSANQLQKLFKNISSMLGIALAVMVCYLIMLVISTAVIMMIGNGL